MGRDDPQQRVRSEPTPDAGRVARVRESRARAQQERAAMAADFRARLTKELAINGSASQQGLIDCATSAHVEICVVTGRFLRCCATSAEMDRLQQARNAFNRALRLLGVTPKATADETGPTLEEYIAAHQRAKEASGQ